MHAYTGQSHKNTWQIEQATNLLHLYFAYKSTTTSQFKNICEHKKLQDWYHYIFFFIKTEDLQINDFKLNVEMKELGS